MRKLKSAVLCIVTVLMVVSMIPVGVHAEEQEKVIIEAVGWFTHFPMRATKGVIEETCAKFGDQVELTLYDESKQEGEDFLASKGLAGHIPMRLYIDGANAFNLDGAQVAFRDFVDYKWWTAADLERAITLALENGVEGISVDIPDEFAVAGSISSSDSSSDSSSALSSGSDSGGNTISPIILSVAAGVVVIAAAGYFIFRPKKRQAKTPVKKGRV